MENTPTKQMNVCRVIRSRIIRGIYSGRLPGLRPLAAELKTDPRTVQSAMAQLEFMGLVKRMPRKGVFVLPAEERLASPGSNFICLFTEAPMVYKGDIGALWQAPIIVVLQHLARERRLDVVLRFFDDAERATAEALDNAGNRRCAGTCFLGLPLNTAGVLRLAQSGGSVVIADYDVEEVLLPCVVFDDYTAGRQAAEHLIALGHRRIAFSFCGITRGSHTQQERWRGFSETLQRAGLTPPSPLATGQEFADQFLASPRDAHSPTAVVFLAAMSAEEIIRDVEAAGMEVPRDLSVVVFGGSWTALWGRRITTVTLDFEAMARTMLETLLDERAFREPRRKLISSTLEEGTTTGPPRASG